MTIDLAPNNPYGLTLASPVLAAAGCLGFGVEYARIVPLDRLGALITPTVALRGARARPARVVETPAGLLYAGAWPIHSLRDVLGRFAATWAGWKTPVLISVTGETPADYAGVAAALEGVEGVAGIELSLAEHPGREAAIVAAVRATTLLPLLAKLPARDSLAALAQSVAAAGADALTVAAPPRALAFDPRSGERLEGWLCGPAWRPLAARLIAEVAAAVEIPVIGSGGVANADDARQLMAAGARAVQLGSALLADPLAATRVADDL